MTELLTAAQMRAAEQTAIQSGDVTGLALMEQAGAGVVASVLSRWPDMAESAGRAIVLCGPGNNGGDGFVIARLLADRGWSVDVFLLGDPARLPPDAQTNADRWRTLGPIHPLPMAEPPQGGGAGLVVDALFGTGLTRAVGPDIAAGVFAPLDQPGFTGWRRVAVDIPSGLCSDSGRVLQSAQGEGIAFRADLTVSFHRAKLGHMLAEGPDYCGDLEVADIGLVAGEREGSVVRSVTAPSATALTKGSGHKYTHGHALLLSGPPGKGGAARLAARGALRVGAGVVTLGCPMRAVFEHAAQLNAIMVRGLDGTAGLDEMLEDRRFTALCLGPGLGLGGATSDLVLTALRARRGTVLDADALSRFQRKPEVLLDALHEACVLTPHAGEFARLFPDLAAQMTAVPEHGPAVSRVDAVRAAAARAGCVVLLKGPDTVIATADGTCFVHAACYDRATPWLATAGAGDVLAGMICGLMARGHTAFDAARIAVWLHVEAARLFGPGLIAEDLPEMVPQVFRQLGA